MQPHECREVEYLLFDAFQFILGRFAVYAINAKSWRSRAASGRLFAGQKSILAVVIKSKNSARSP